MIKLWQQNYCDLLQELKNCKRRHPEENSQLRCCYMKSYSAWETINKQSENYQFPDLREEITFFKQIRPKFFAEREYYHRLYFVHCFLPSEPSSAREFLAEEMCRLQRFTNRHQEFYSYQKSSRTDKDKEWFSGGNIDKSEVAGYLITLERYNEYLADKIRLIDKI